MLNIGDRVRVRCGTRIEATGVVEYVTPDGWVYVRESPRCAHEWPAEQCEVIPVQQRAG